MPGFLLFVLGIVLGFAVSPYLFIIAAVPIIITVLSAPRYRF